MVTTYDVPIDTSLFDEKGLKPDISNTSHMNGISIDVEGRTAWAFYTDDGETARIVSEGERRQGMFIVSTGASSESPASAFRPGAAHHRWRLADGLQTSLTCCADGV